MHPQPDLVRDEDGVTGAASQLVTQPLPVHGERRRTRQPGAQGVDQSGPGQRAQHGAEVLALADLDGRPGGQPAGTVGGDAPGHLLVCRDRRGHVGDRRGQPGRPALADLRLARPGSSEHPDAVITGTPRVVIDLLIGNVDLDEAKARGLRYEGDPQVFSRLRPKAVARTT